MNSDSFVWSGKLDKNCRSSMPGGFFYGYGYAAGRMLRQAPTEDVIQELQSQVDCARHFDDYSAFDRGVEHAIDRMVQLGIAKYATRTF